MGEILDFCEKSNRMDMDPIFQKDAYLRLAALNALQKAGYSLNREGLLAFQHSIAHEETGKLSMDDFIFLLQVHEPDERQAILNHIDKLYNGGTIVKNNKKPSYGSIIVFLIALCFFELYGIISCFFDIWRLFK